MIEIIIPKLGLTMEKARLVRWEFASGDEVRKGETILIIETDKVTFEVPAPADGIIHPVVENGTICAVEETVGYLAKDRKEYEQILKEHSVSEVKRETFEVKERSEKHRIKASPLARSMAATHNLDLSAITGSGSGGRIVKADILGFLDQRTTGIEKKKAIPLEEIPRAIPRKEISEKIPIQGVRRVIFDNMFHSLSQSAQLTLHTEACAEALISLRERLSQGGQKISYNAILIKISAMSLREHPRINASVKGDQILVWRQINIGLAMEANKALVVPVITCPDLKTIREIGHEIKDLIHKTRENRLSPDDLANGTFTISNLGFADIDHFTPIIRPPESAILGTGRITHKPVVRGDHVVPEARIGLSLTFDHRIIDGAPAARFLKTIKDMIEDPLLMVR